MKLRLCDRCNGKIEGKFIKCCESEMISQTQKLKHIGDLCLNCWNIIKIKGDKR